MLPEASCRILLHVAFPWLFAFGHKVCEPEGRAFPDEPTFSRPLSGCSRRFNRVRPASAAGKIGCGANLRLSWSPSRRGPLHSSTAERGDVAEISPQLPRAP